MYLQIDTNVSDARRTSCLSMLSKIEENSKRVSCGVRTHAQLPAVDHKCTPQPLGQTDLGKCTVTRQPPQFAEGDHKLPPRSERSRLANQSTYCELTRSCFLSSAGYSGRLFTSRSGARASQGAICAQHIQSITPPAPTCAWQ